MIGLSDVEGLSAASHACVSKSFEPLSGGGRGRIGFSRLAHIIVREKNLNDVCQNLCAGEYSNAIAFCTDSQQRGTLTLLSFCKFGHDVHVLQKM